MKNLLWDISGIILLMLNQVHKGVDIMFKLGKPWFWLVLAVLLLLVGASLWFEKNWKVQDSDAQANFRQNLSSQRIEVIESKEWGDTRIYLLRLDSTQAVAWCSRDFGQPVTCSYWVPNWPPQE